MRRLSDSKHSKHITPAVIFPLGMEEIASRSTTSFAGVALHPMRMAKGVSRQIMLTIGAAPPETGGILLGPTGTDEITDFYYDYDARCSPATYSPNHVLLRKRMEEEWMPSGIDMKGFVHSHPAGLARLSAGDMTYIRRLLSKNPDMAFFAAPIVLPDQFRICPFVVSRDDPDRSRRATLVLF